MRHFFNASTKHKFIIKSGSVEGCVTMYDLFESLPELQPYVAAFWAQEKPSASFASQILLPDSYFELIIALGPSRRWELESGEHIHVPSANIVRMQQQPFRVRALQD